MKRESAAQQKEINQCWKYTPSNVKAWGVGWRRSCNDLWILTPHGDTDKGWHGVCCDFSITGDWGKHHNILSIHWAYCSPEMSHVLPKVGPRRTDVGASLEFLLHLQKLLGQLNQINGYRLCRLKREWFVNWNRLYMCHTLTTSVLKGWGR